MHDKIPADVLPNDSEALFECIIHRGFTGQNNNSKIFFNL